MFVIVPSAISFWTRFTSATGPGHVGEILPIPTPPEATSKIVSSPPLKPPSTTSWIVWKTASSTFFSALVAMCVAEIRLVGVDADPAHVLLLRGREGAEAALARDLEDHVGAAGDLVERELLALRLVDEVLRVGVQGRDLPGSRPSRPPGTPRCSGRRAGSSARRPSRSPAARRPPPSRSARRGSRRGSRPPAP